MKSKLIMVVLLLTCATVWGQDHTIVLSVHEAWDATGKPVPEFIYQKYGRQYELGDSLTCDDLVAWRNWDEARIDSLFISPRLAKAQQDSIVLIRQVNVVLEYLKSLGYELPKKPDSARIRVIIIPEGDR